MPGPEIIPRNRVIGSRPHEGAISISDIIPSTSSGAGNRYGTLSVIYKGIGTNRKWEDIESYGPKFVENIVQAIARDLLLNAMSNLNDLPIVAHVHDEVIIENDGSITLDEVCDRMARLPSWATGLILRADGYECPYYQKQ